MAMMERLLLQVLEKKKSIVGQVKHHARLFDQHLASTLLIDGIDPPDWVLPSHPAEYKSDEITLELFQRPSKLPDPITSCCPPVNEEALVNDEQLMVDSGDDNLGSMMETCDGGRKLLVLPEDVANCVSGGRDTCHGTEFMASSPNVQNMEGTGKSHHGLELSLASLKRSKSRQKALELRSSAKASQSPSQGEINESSVDGRIATSGITCRTDVQLDDAADMGEVLGISHERISIRELSSENRICVDEPGVCSSLKDCGVDVSLIKSLAVPDCTLGEASNTRAEVKVFVMENLGDTSIMDFKSNDCSEKVSRSQRSTCYSNVDNVLELDGNLHGEKSKASDEQITQSIPVDILQEADKKCGADQIENDVCHEIQHESVSECLMDSRRFSEVADGNKLVDMDNSANVGEFSVERSGTDGQASKTSEPLILFGCQSVEPRSVVFSQCISASAGNQPNIQGINTDMERYVEDSAGGFLPSSSPVDVISLGKSEMDADHLTEKDMEGFAPSSISHREMLLQPKQLKFANSRESVVGINIDSVTISEEKIHSCSLLRQTLINPTDHKNDKMFGDLEDHPEGTIQRDTLPEVIVDSSLYSDQEQDQYINLASDGGESLKFISSLSSDRIDDRKEAGLGEQEQTCAEEKNQPNALCSEEEHIEPDLQESNVMGFPSSQFSDFLGEDQNIPEMEGFVITTDDDDHSCISEDGLSYRTRAVENVTMQNGRILEQLGLSASLKTPLQQPFIGNTDNQDSRLYQTVPNGLLENVDLRSSLALNDGEQVDHAIDGRSFSDCLPYAEAASALSNGKPYASPVGKLWESVHANSGSSKHKSSSVPELPCISEETEFADEAVDGLEEIVSVKMAIAKREPLAEISEDPNIPVYNDGNELARYTLDSMMIETTFSTANERLRVKHKTRESRKEDFARKIKSSKAFEKGENGVKREVQSPRNKLSHPKTCMEDGGFGISRKKSKLNNIVSSMTSFLPFVQQKQAAAPCAGKRNVKVKALEAAEAAKRQAEKREMERKMKKEALKVERERVEKENKIRMELEKKKKDEERKKKEAEMALKKRLREEDDKREKEKKRRHIKEPHKKTVDRQETSCTDRQELPETKDLVGDAVLTEKTESGVGSGQQFMDHEDRNIDGPDHLSKSTSGLVGREKIQHDLSEDSGNLEPSYDISPYKCSDDEDEEEEDTPDEKFIPSWAWKGSIARDVFLQQYLDPDVIFPLDSFCSISEVVMPLKYQLKLHAGAGSRAGAC